jgi:hypothetical protein
MRFVIRLSPVEQPAWQFKPSQEEVRSRGANFGPYRENFRAIRKLFSASRPGDEAVKPPA